MDGPPPLVIKKEFSSPRFIRFRSNILSPKENPLVITIDDDDDLEPRLNNENVDFYETRLNNEIVDFHEPRLNNENVDFYEPRLNNENVDFYEPRLNKENVDFYEPRLNNENVDVFKSQSDENIDVFEPKLIVDENNEQESTQSKNVSAGTPIKPTEDVSSCNKTPTSVLNEFCQVRGIKPEYEFGVKISEIKTGNCIPIFQYRIRVGNVEATGSSSTKKKAKHAAAENILKKLNTGEFEGKSKNNDSKNNPIGRLQELCMCRKFQLPRYEECWDKDSSNWHQFKIVCIVSEIQKIGLGKTKKIAKREAAFLMLEALKNLNFSQSLDDGRPTGKYFDGLNGSQQKWVHVNKKEKTNGKQENEKEKTNENQENEKEKTNENQENEKEKANLKQGEEADMDQMNDKSVMFGKDLYICGNESCDFAAETEGELKEHLFLCDNSRYSAFLTCPHCNIQRKNNRNYLQHLKLHGEKMFKCGFCDFASGLKTIVSSHLLTRHGLRQQKAKWKECSRKGHFELVLKEEKKVLKTKKTQKERSKPIVLTYGVTNRKWYGCCLPNCNFIGSDYINLICHLKDKHGKISLETSTGTFNAESNISSSTNNTNISSDHEQNNFLNNFLLRRRWNVRSYKDIHNGKTT